MMYPPPKPFPNRMIFVQMSKPHHYKVIFIVRSRSLPKTIQTASERGSEEEVNLLYSGIIEQSKAVVIYRTRGRMTFGEDHLACR